MDPCTMHKAAKHSLSVAPYSAKKLALIHVGITVLVSALLSTISFFLSRNIDSSSGLQGIESRVVLRAFLTILQLSSNVLLPFWEIGFLYTALRICHTQDAEPTDLLQGFRRFGPVLRLILLQFILILAVNMICSFVSSFLFSFTPFMQDAAQRIESMPDFDATTASLSETLSLVPEMIYMLVIFAIVLLVVGVPLYYRLRLSNYAIMDDTTKARVALNTSTRLTMGRRMQLFKMDLHFWWYYLAYVLIVIIGFGDNLLALLGVSVPIQPSVLFFVCLVLSSVLRLLLVWQYGALVQTSYAHFYFHLKLNSEPHKAESPATPSNPWN